MGSPDETAYYLAGLELVEDAYLTAESPYAQSGKGGGAPEWERARRVITVPMDRDGAFLDIGCANGLLMESVHEWCAVDGVRIEPHGLDLSPGLADLARTRLPQWADRIHEGNAMTWRPPRRYDYVRTELLYVPEWRRADLVRRILDDYLTPGGRAIICSYGSSRRPAPLVEPVWNELADYGFDVAGQATARELNGVAVTTLAWIEA